MWYMFLKNDSTLQRLHYNGCGFLWFACPGFTGLEKPNPPLHNFSKYYIQFLFLFLYAGVARFIYYCKYINVAIFLLILTYTYC